MASRLDRKVILITGAGSGIGRATALACAREGARVVVADVDDDGGSETVGLIGQAGGTARFVHVDVTKADEVDSMVEEAVSAFGRLDCAHNNVGGGSSIRAPIHEYPEEDFDRIMTLNVKGVWLCLKAELRQMLAQGGGSIVNTASIMGLVGTPLGNLPYTASKHGIVGMTKTAAIVYANQGIRINAVCPAYMQNALEEGGGDAEGRAKILARHPMGRVGRVEEVAEAVIWLSSDAASFVTGHSLPVDGGYVAQ